MRVPITWCRRSYLKCVFDKTGGFTPLFCYPILCTGKEKRKGAIAGNDTSVIKISCSLSAPGLSFGTTAHSALAMGTGVEQGKKPGPDLIVSSLVIGVFLILPAAIWRVPIFFFLTIYLFSLHVHLLYAGNHRFFLSFCP